MEDMQMLLLGMKIRIIISTSMRLISKKLWTGENLVHDLFQLLFFVCLFWYCSSGIPWKYFALTKVAMLRGVENLQIRSALYMPFVFSRGNLKGDACCWLWYGTCPGSHVPWRFNAPKSSLCSSMNSWDFGFSSFNIKWTHWIAKMVSTRFSRVFYTYKFEFRMTSWCTDALETGCWFHAFRE